MIQIIIYWFLGCLVQVDTNRQIHHVVGQGDQCWEPLPLHPWRPKLTGSLLWNVCCVSGAWLRVAWVGLQIGPTSGFTLRTNTRGTKSWSWSRVTNLTTGASSVTSLCRTSYSMSGISRRPFSEGESRGSGVAWRMMRHGWGQSWQSQHMESPLPRSPP